MSALYTANAVAIFLGSLTSLSYALLFGFTSKWWRTFIGQQHLAISALLAILYVRSAILIILNPNPTPPRVFSVVMGGLVTLTITWGLINYLRLQYLKRERS